MAIQKIFMASDHAGVELKAALKQYLVSAGYDAEDLGPADTASVDYPDYAHKLADAIDGKNNSRGILICGSGQGIAMAANKHAHIRAAVICADQHADEISKLARQHNDANVLCFGARFISPEIAKACTDIFMTTEREAGRHASRVAKISPP